MYVVEKKKSFCWGKLGIFLWREFSYQINWDLFWNLYFKSKKKNNQVWGNCFATYKLYRQFHLRKEYEKNFNENLPSRAFVYIISYRTIGFEKCTVSAFEAIAALFSLESRLAQ